MRGLMLVFAIVLCGFSSSQKTQNASALVESVWIEKSDGSVSCETNSGQPTEKVASELRMAGIEVIRNQKGNDGLVRMQMCGIETGNLNQIQIRKSDLEKAKALGFVLSQSPPR